MMIEAKTWRSLDELEKSNLIIQAYQRTYNRRIRYYERETLRKIKNSRPDKSTISQKVTLTK